MATIRLTHFASMTSGEKEECVKSFLSSSGTLCVDHCKSQLTTVNEKINRFEGRYEMSSSTMKQTLSLGNIKETADICSWLFLLKQKESLEKQSPEARAKSVIELLQDS